MSNDIEHLIITIRGLSNQKLEQIIHTFHRFYNVDRPSESDALLEMSKRYVAKLNYVYNVYVIYRALYWFLWCKLRLMEQS